ncbi:MAG TPA: response regulator [Fibrobacteria bacterium]|nr:response regulator [Fibrobacteria bacterium]
MDKRNDNKKMIQVVETVLLVDGDSACRNALKFILELNGYRVVEATHGIEATQLVNAYGERIHLVLCAAVLPDMTAPEWVGRTKVVDPELPVLVLKEWERMEAAITPMGPWYGGLPARGPTPNRLLERIRSALDDHFFARFLPAPAA